MAYGKRQPNGTMRVWNSDGTSIPRASIKFLDNYSDDQVKAYLQNLNATANKINPDRLTDKTRELIEAFCAWKAKKGKHHTTVQQERRHVQLAASFFDQFGALSLWPQNSMELRTDLLEKGFKEAHINKIQGSVARFWKYARKNKKLVTGVLDFDETVNHAVVGATPLQRHVTPGEVLAFAKDCPYNDIKLFALLGYFASMRPQEIMAMSKKDIVGGKEASKLECCKVMKEHGQFGGVAIYVQRQRGSKKTDIRIPKWGTVANVAIFNKEAALLIRSLLKGIEGDLPFSKYGNRYYTDKWKKHGLSLLNPKDPRRASIYWLANYGSVSVIPLSLHARHKDVKTTGLYYRRVEKESDGEWDIEIEESA